MKNTKHTVVVAVALIACLAITIALTGCQQSATKAKVVSWEGTTVTIQNTCNDTFKAGEIKVSGPIYRHASSSEEVGTIWNTNSKPLGPGEKQTIQLKTDFHKGTAKDYPNWVYTPTRLKITILREWYV